MSSEATQALLDAPPAEPVEQARAPAVGSWLSRLRADPARLEALQDALAAFWISRVLVVVCGVGTVLAFGYGPVRKVLNPPGVVEGVGWLGDLLAAPVARWDSTWYLVIAHYGYRPDLGSYTSARAAFFPLYPLAIRGISDLGAPPLIAGVAISLAAFALALYGLHRLTALELGAAKSEVPRLAVLLLALTPMSFYLSAVYSESLYLALSIGVFWCARNGRWGMACMAGALAAATRSAGIVLALPVLYMYLYGPREDRPADRPAEHWWRPRYRLRRDVLWLIMLPLGLALYLGYLALSGGDALEPFHAQEVWGRHFAGPFGGVLDGARAALDGVGQLVSGQNWHAYFSPHSGDPTVAAAHNVLLAVFLLAALAALVGTLRRLPRAYGLYVLVALALPLSYPVASQPLMSLPRFLLVLFPLYMWFALWLSEHPRARLPALAFSAALMVVFLGQFATWHWVA